MHHPGCPASTAVLFGKTGKDAKTSGMTPGERCQNKDALARTNKLAGKRILAHKLRVVRKSAIKTLITYLSGSRRYYSGKLSLCE